METKEKATKDNLNLQDNLEDLSIPDEQSKEAKGGRGDVTTYIDVSQVYGS